MDDTCQSDDPCPLGTPQEAWSIVAAVAAATKDVKEIKVAIHGNGRNGLLADVARLNLKMNIVCFVSGVLLTAMGALLVKLLS